MNSSDNNYDAIIIGAGLGGLITGAILAKLEGMKVLVLEKEETIGGKLFTFEHYEGDEKTFLKKLYTHSRSRLVDSSSDFSEMIGNKTFSKYIIEGGWHSFINSDRSRQSFIAQALGENLKVFGNEGFRLYGEDKWEELRYLQRNWTKEDFQEGKVVSREMNLMSKEEAEEYDNIDLESFLRSRTTSQNVINFHLWLAGWEVGTNNPKNISAGEHIKVISMVHCAGKDFTNGGGGQPLGGHLEVARLFAKVIEENGGTIRVSTPVEELVIENYKATGVKTADGIIKASKIICNVPMWRAIKLIGSEYFPDEFLKRSEDMEPCGGILGWISTKRPLDPDYRGLYILPVLPGCKKSDGFTGDVLFSFEDVATYDKSRAPEGEGLMPIWAAMDIKNPDEIHNKELIDKIVKGIFTFMRKEYPDFDELLNWYIVTACEELYSVASKPGMVGNLRMPTKSPLVKNLFFTGDGTQQWSFGQSGAAGGAVNCASAVTGKDCSVILPFFMR